MIKKFFKKVWLVIKLVFPLWIKFWWKSFKEEWNKITYNYDKDKL